MRSIRKGLMVGGALGLMVAFAGGGCASMDPRDKGYTFPVELSKDIPAAKGKVKVEPQKDGNNVVKLEIEHLAPPYHADPQATYYVVWLKPQGAPPQNVGVLKVDGDQKGKFETRTAFEKFDVLVTAERMPNATQPSPHQMVRASVQASGQTM
jgi:hypothetical protein